MISLLERRRLEARAHDEIQRRAGEEAAKIRSAPVPRREFQPLVREAQSPDDDDVLASMLVSDPGRVATVADVQVIFTHFEQQIENHLRESTGLGEIDDLHADRER